MARKTRVVFVCQQCGGHSPRWAGRCPDCGAWNSLTETVETPEPTSSRISALPRAAPVALTRIETGKFERIQIPIDEFNRVLGGGIVPGSVILVGGDPGIGKCVTADTRVLDPETGSYRRISELSSTDGAVLSLDEPTLRLNPQSVGAFFSRGVHPIVALTTDLGRTLRCTADHPILTPSGWQMAGELKPGDYVASPRALPYFGRRELPEAAVKLIAYILSDGSAQASICVTSNLPEVADDLRVIADHYGMRLIAYDKARTNAKQYRFVSHREGRPEARRRIAEALKAAHSRLGISWQEWARRAEVSYAILNRWRRGSCAPSTEELGRLAAAAEVPVSELSPDAREAAERKTPVARFLEEIGLRYLRAADKRVPECVFELPRGHVALFLRTLFTCDGSVYVNGRGQPGISYSTIGRRLAEDVQHLLLRFGLVAKLRTKRSRVGNRAYVAYEVVLLGLPIVRAFLSTIGLHGRRKAVDRITAMSAPGRASTGRDVIPTGETFWQELRGLASAEGFGQLSLRAGVRVLDRRHDRPLCRSTVAALAVSLGDQHLDALANGDVYWDEVVGVAPVGEAPVYDISVPGKANFVANDLIVHNSTILLQVASLVSEAVGRVLYISGEESPEQIRLRAERLGIAGEHLFVLGETSLEPILGTIEEMRPALVVVDSIQTMYLESVPSAAGSISQVRECAMALLRMAKTTNVPIFLVGHVTKEGAIAGPRVLEHIVDTVLYLEGERFHTYRLLRGQKNRFGSTNEVGVFEMQEAGMVEVSNPSAVFLQERPETSLGSAVAVTLEGTRPILVEVQALTSPTSFGLPRRTANGIELNRLLLLTAVLTKQVGLSLSNQDIYVNVVGGLKVNEPAVDLAVSLAIASSYRDLPVAHDLAAIGEVGLSGELRRVGHVDRRLSEAGKLGFRRCLLPRAMSGERLAQSTGVELLGARTLHEALEIALHQGA